MHLNGFPTDQIPIKVALNGFSGEILVSDMVFMSSFLSGN